jgi:hypothetical protein
MAVIGIEYIDHFADVRAAGVLTEGGQDLSCPIYLAGGFGYDFDAAGHQLKFIRSNHDVEERHMRDSSFGGDDEQNADSVSLFFIITHGNYKNRELGLLYDNQVDGWFGYSKKWRFGDRCSLKWLMIYGCHSIDSDDVGAHLHIFQRLHLFCGAYGDMFDSWTIHDAGDETASDLLSGKTVADSWGDGISDWWVSNHPMVISVERAETYRGGDPDWGATVIGGDHFWGAGTTLDDVKPADQYWMAAYWWDGGIYG